MKRTNILRIIISLIIIFCIVGMNMSVVYASLVSGAQAESGAYTPPPTPPDTTQTPIPTPTPTPTPDPGPQTITHTITSMEYISGNVYEYLGNESTEAGKDAEEKREGIEDVIVICKDSGGNEVGRTRTNSDGSWGFNITKNGTYSIEYLYGNLDGIDLNDENKVKNVLKYNGQDYLASKIETPGATATESTTVNIGDDYTAERWEIQESEKGVSQVFLTIDCSYSMRKDKIKINGTEKTKLAVAVESAEQLVHELLNSGENIYVGLVFFSGTSYWSHELSKNETSLNKTLETIRDNGWYTHNTDITAAFNKTMESFWSENNRYMILISDGIPTKCDEKGIETYYNESKAETIAKLEKIKQYTKEKVEEVRKEGLKLVSLFTLSEEETETREWVKDIFGESDELKLIDDDGDKVEDYIKEEIKDYIIKESETHETTTTYKVAQGYEDAERNKQISENFSRFEYKNNKLFNLIQNYKSSDAEDAKTLSNLTYGKVIGGKGYTIDIHSDAEAKGPDPVTDEDGNILYYTQTVVVHSGYDNQNLYLAKKPQFSLALDIDATGLRVILLNNSIKYEETRDIGSKEGFVRSMDDQAIYGATVQIEYTARIRNNSPIKCTYLELINYLPDGFEFVGKSNSATKIETVNLKDLYDNENIAQNVYETYKNRNAIKITLDNIEISADGFYDVKFTCSRKISSFDDLDYVTDIGEILAYENNANRRMTILGESNSQEVLIGMYPANNNVLGAEMDWSESSEVSLIPPTGITADMENIIKLSLVGLVILAVTIIKLRKRKNK